MGLLWGIISLVYNWAERPWYNVLAIWLNKCMSRPGSYLQLDVTNLQLCKTIGLEYIKKVSHIGYGM